VGAELPDLPLTLEDGAALAAVVDEIGYFAMTPGTADLQFGAELLKMLDDETAMTVLSANLKQDGELVFAPSTMLSVSGKKIGIFGLTSPLASGMGAEVESSTAQIMEAAEAAVADLKAQGADYVVALTNMGFEQGGFSDADLDWAADYMSGHVDLIIDGMGTVPYQEVRGSTLYVQLGGGAYAGGIEITVTERC